MRERRVDLEGLLGLLDLLLLGHRAERAHVVQAVGELDQDDPDVRGHRDHHLAVVLGLRLVAALERDPGELGDAVDQAGDLLAELLAHLVQGRGRVLDGVVQQRGAQRRRVQAHAGADLGHADRVRDEVLARTGGAGRRGARRRTGTRRSTALRSIGSATSSACSETIANRSASSSCSSVVRSSGIASVPSSPCSARSTGRCAATATGGASPPVSGRSPLTPASFRPLAAPRIAAGQVLPSVLEPSLVGHERRGALERGALRVLRHA